MKKPFNIEELEIGYIIEFYNGDQVKVESISKCLCGQCDVYYINDHISTDYNSIQYMIVPE